MLPIILAAGLSLAQVDGCSKDTDCKGDRVCENRVCVAPSASPPESLPPPVPPAQVTTPVQPQEASSAHRHRGLFLRPDIGVGYLTASASQPGTDVTLYGGAGYFGFALGGSVADGVILAGHLWGMGVANPSITVNGQSGSSVNTSMGFAAIGPEFDYYFMPTNLFISTTIAASRGSLSTGGNDYNTQVGIAGQIAFGKEWWVSDQWGLGVKGELTISANKDNAASDAPTWVGFAFAIGFSATYN